MHTVAVAGGSRSEIKELVQLSLEDWGDQVKFIVFDTEDNIDSDDLWEYRGYSSEEEMVREAVRSVASGESGILLKGGIKTHALLKEVLKKKYKLKKQDLRSHVALVNLPALDRHILLTDAGMNITPDDDQLEQIINNAIQVGQSIGLKKPKVALISSAENVNPKMPSSLTADRLTKRFKNYEEATVYGPISLDLSLSEAAVASKRFTGPIAGDADILVVPNIDVGNVLYKTFLLFGDATIGGTIVGTNVPIVLTSRSDKVRSKLYALRFALMQAESNQ